MQPHPMSPDHTEDHHEKQQQSGPDRTATSLPLPSPRDIYATLASTVAQPMDAKQYYRQVLQELPATHGTLQGGGKRHRATTSGARGRPPLGGHLRSLQCTSPQGPAGNLVP